jgi:Zn-dependent peptidase ImmA (M78 family)
MNGIESCRSINYTYVHCREIAETFLDSHGWLTLPNIPVINIEIVSQRARIPINIIDDLQLFGLYGIGFKNLKENRIEIFIDANHYTMSNKSAQFTIAEEVGHSIIHSSIFEGINSIEDRMKYENSLNEETHQIFERAAKRVGSELLLPCKIFNPFVLDWCKKHIANLQKISPNDEKELSEYIAEKLSPEFDLSNFIINKALNRWNPKRLIDELIFELNIELIKNAPDTRVQISEEVKIKAKRRQQKGL